MGIEKEEIVDVDEFEKVEDTRSNFLNFDTYIPAPGEDEEEEVFDEPSEDEEEYEDEEVLPGVENIIFENLIKDNILLPFEDEEGNAKPVSKYTPEEVTELIKLNIQSSKDSGKEEALKEIKETFPEEFHSIVDYIKDGGTNVKEYMRSLIDVVDIKSLSPDEEEDREFIVHYYLSTKDMDDALIASNIEDWKSSGLLEKKAREFKPLLDKVVDSKIQQDLEYQKELKNKQIAIRQEFVNDMSGALSKDTLNGISVSKEIKSYLLDEITNAKYKTRSGRPTNLLGNLIEEYQFGKEKKPELILEALWLLSKPDEYKEFVRKKEVSVEAEKTFKKLKTNAQRTDKQLDIDTSGNNKKVIKRDKPNFLKRFNN
jgi:hypothetical protein